MKKRVETMDTMIRKEDLNFRKKYIEVKYIHCKYEKEMFTECYRIEAYYLLDIGETSSSCWHCPKCYKDTLCRKGIKL